MAAFKHFKLSDNGVIENHVSVNDDGEIVARDVMSAQNVQTVLDSNKRVRNDSIYNPQAGGRLAARIPLPIYTEWRKKWKEKHRQDMTWQTYLAIKINNRDYCQFRLTDSKLYVPENVRTAG